MTAASVILGHHSSPGALLLDEAPTFTGVRKTTEVTRVRVSERAHWWLRRDRPRCNRHSLQCGTHLYSGLKFDGLVFFSYRYIFGNIIIRSLHHPGSLDFLQLARSSDYLWSGPAEDEFHTPTGLLWLHKPASFL